MQLGASIDRAAFVIVLGYQPQQAPRTTAESENIDFVCMALVAD